MKPKLRYYEKDGRTYVTAAEGVPVCDFCSSTPVEKIFKAKDILIDSENESEGGWAACRHCAALIDANDREGLFNRVMVKLSHQIEDDADEMADAIRTVQQKFWEAKE